MAPWDPAAWEAVKLEPSPAATVQLDLLACPMDDAVNGGP
jgi:hypothetical protein